MMTNAHAENAHLAERARLWEMARETPESLDWHASGHLRVWAEYRGLNIQVEFRPSEGAHWWTVLDTLEDSWISRGSGIDATRPEAMARALRCAKTFLVDGPRA